LLSRLKNEYKKEGEKMEYLAAPAFVFALAALAQVGTLKKKVENLEKYIEENEI
jgi:hypothetical protein